MLVHDVIKLESGHSSGKTQMGERRVEAILMGKRRIANLILRVSVILSLSDRYNYML